MDEYWTDIGNTSEYKKGDFDVLDTKVKIDPGVENEGNKYISRSAKFDRNIKIYAPCLIGNNVVIGKNVVIEPHSVISSNVKISGNVYIWKSILWKNSKVGSNVKIINTIIGFNTMIPSNIVLFDSIMMEYSNKLNRE
jgi:mannose-1-phosphate guanylyltransferase/phosphomannomutase